MSRIGVVLAATAGLAYPQTPASPRPEFEVASIKPSEGCSARSRNVQGPAPERLNLECTTLERAIQSAYGLYADGLRLNARLVRVAGGPAWIRSDYYDISATSNSNLPRALIYGPMLQALLEDRFHLKLHRETEEIPVYALTVAKGGPKMKRSEAGSCIPVDVNNLPAPPVPGGPMPVYCGRPIPGTSGRNVTMNARGMGMSNLSDELLSRILDRPVIDKTGLTGLFDFHLEFTPDDTTRMNDASKVGDTVQPSSDPGALSIFSAIETQLGLKLVPDKGSFGVLIVDRVERPTAN